MGPGDHEYGRWMPPPPGVVRAEFRRDPAWELAARRAISHVARHQLVFDEDAIWRTLRAAGYPPPIEPRWLAALLRNAARAGVCRRVEDELGVRWQSNRYEKVPEL